MKLAEITSEKKVDWWINEEQYELHQLHMEFSNGDFARIQIFECMSPKQIVNELEQTINKIKTSPGYRV